MSIAIRNVNYNEYSVERSGRMGEKKVEWEGEQERDLSKNHFRHLKLFLPNLNVLIKPRPALQTIYTAITKGGRSHILAS